VTRTLLGTTGTPTGPLAQSGLADLAGVVLPAVARLLGLALSAAVAVAVVAVVYRWYVREPLPDGLAVLLGLGVVALYLNAVGLFGQVLAPVAGESPLSAAAIVSNVSALLGGALAAPVGRRVGDRTALSLFDGVAVSEGNVGRFRGRLSGATPVELPPAEEIDDIPGYDPVSEATRERLGGRTVVLARGPGDLAERLGTHLRETHDVGRVDVDVVDGTVAHLGLGTRPAGIAPTLAPGTVAVAVRADPPNGAGPGDVVQVWPAADPSDGASPGPETGPVTTAELRATAGDVVTLAVDEADAAALSAERTYRLVTLPARESADREFASLLSAADERMDAVTVAGDGPLVGAAVGDLDPRVTVVAVRTPDGDLDALPVRSRPLAAGETVYVIASPEAIRRLAERAGGD